MKHVYLFSSYSNAVNMAAAIAALNSNDVEFIIHVNRRTNIDTNVHLRALQNQSNVHFIQDRVNVNWGGFSHLVAIIKLMQQAISDTNADYMHLMSDSCYPIKSPLQINTFFEANKGKEFITYTPLPDPAWPFGGLNRIQYYHLHDIIDIKKRKWYWHLNQNLMLLQLHLKLKRKIEQLPYYGGGTWWSLSRDAVSYCLDTIAATPDFYHRYRHTFCYEESCFHTILLNSRFRDHVVNDDLRYVDWQARNGNNPANLDMTDHDALLASTDLFARKFVYPTSEKLQETLAARAVS